MAIDGVGANSAATNGTDAAAGGEEFAPDDLAMLVGEVMAQKKALEEAKKTSEG